MSESGKAVFLSYASQDAEAAKRICDALRAAGVEVWFDQSELVGGDAWDAKIRGQISSCALFMPVISATTQARREGYFRLEWKLAAQRTHAMSDDTAFLLPVLIDDTPDAVAKVPVEFKAVQWTRLPGGEATPAFGARVRQLLSDEPEPGNMEQKNVTPPAHRRRATPAKWWWALPIFGVAMALLLVMRESRKEPGSAIAPTTPALSPARQLVERARQLRSFNGLTREKLGAAEDLLDQALKLDPLEAEVWAVGAQVDALMEYRGWDNSDARRQSAAKRASRALALAADGFESRHAQAVLSGFMVKTPEAIAEAETAYRALLQERPDDRDLLEELGTLLRESRRYDEAIALFERAGRPALAGRAYGAAGRYGEARRIADELLAEKRTAEALILKANVELFGFNDRSAAQAAVNQLTPTELREDEAAAIALRLAVLSSDAPGILKLLDTYPRPFVSIGVDYPRQYWTGIARMIQQQPEAAEIEWRGALQSIDERAKARPNDTQPMVWSGILRGHLGDREGAERAIRLYRNYVDLSAGYWDWSYGLTLLSLGGRNDEVIDRLEKTMRDPALPLNYVLYAWARFSPEFDPLRGNPRFEKLLRDKLPKGAKAFDDDKTTDNGPPTPAPPDSKSVAVLAFANLSDDKANEYFSDGISEELLNVLAKVPGLKVTARTSSFHFKGKDTPVPEIARQLGVAYVVEGSVRKQGDKVRITAQLIKATDGFHVWSDTFTRDLRDVFAVQDEIAGLVAKNLEAKLGAAPRTGALVDGRALELYMQGRAAWNRRNAEGFDRAEALFREALAIAPDFARAHAALADVWMIRAITDGKLSEYRQRAAPVIPPIEAEVRRALELDPESAEAHATLGFLRQLQHQPDEALRLLRRSVELNPNYATGHHWLAGTLAYQSWFDESIAEYRLAVAIDPLSPRILDNFGWFLVTLGRLQEGLALIDRALALLPDEPQAQAHKVLTLARLGRREEARALGAKVTARYRLAVLVETGDRAAIEAALPAAEGPERGSLLSALGRQNEALDYFHPEDVILEDTQEWFFDPRLVPWHHDPRFRRVVVELGFDEYLSRALAWQAAHPPQKPEGKP